MASNMEEAGVVDVLIIGAGPAGLAAAMGASRQRHTVVIFDSGLYRNKSVDYMHMVPTWDHCSPKEYNKAARQELLNRYQTVQYIARAVTSAASIEATGLFQVTDTTGLQWVGRKLILATGIRDIFPAIPGYAESWGQRILHCLYCHGYEESTSNTAGVLAVGPLSDPGLLLAFARSATQFVSGITIYTNGSESLVTTLKPQLPDGLVKIDTRTIKEFHKGPEHSQIILEFEDGTNVTEAFLVHLPHSEQASPIAAQLSLPLTEGGAIEVSEPFYETKLPGVFAVGDCASATKFVIQSAAMGGFAAAGAAMQLEAENWAGLIAESTSAV